MTMTRSNKFALRLAAGALFGALVGPGLAHLVMYFDLPVGGFSLTPGGVVLAAVGGLYVLMGLFVLIGALWPSLGTLILNVADEEDLRERQAMLRASALVSLGLGAALALLPFAGKDGPVAPQAALAALAGALVLGMVHSWLATKRRHYDELWSHLSIEAAVIALIMLSVLMLIWGVMAYLGMAGPFDPLLAVAAPPGLYLLSSFIAAGRKGLLAAD